MLSAKFRILARLMAVAALAALTAGCFQPMYAEHTDGTPGMAPPHRLEIRIQTSRSSLILDPTTALPSSENYGIDAQYNLVDIATNKSVMTGTTFSRVSYDIPGQQQRFARTRAFRDAEDRAAQEIAENIQTRLAAFFTAGT